MPAAFGRLWLVWPGLFLVTLEELGLHLSLIGLPGSGKSTIGRQVARLLGMAFVDSDLVIEQRLGCSIREYFASHGEAAFRDVEAQVLADLVLHPQPQLLSTGGGAVLRPENRAVLKAHTTVFYLQASPDEIARRLRNDTGRPLMQGEDPAVRLRELQTVRGPLYLQTAHFVIDTVRQSTTQVGRKICMQAEQCGLRSIHAVGGESIG